MADEKYAAALTLLEKQRSELVRLPQLARQADLYLGLCYERLGNPEQQLAAFKRAATGDEPPPLSGRVWPPPFWPMVRLTRPLPSIGP